VLRDDGGTLGCASCGYEPVERDGLLFLTAGGMGRPGFDADYFDYLEGIGDRHYWFVARQEMILAALRSAVPDLSRRGLVEIGCGQAQVTAFLANAGIRIAAAWDAYPNSLALAAQRLDAPLLVMDEGRLPPLGPGNELIGLFDVIEHVDDDVGWLGALRDALAPGGVLVLTVPAHAFLFDEMDELAHHRRRYGRRDLGAKLSDAGFEVRLLSHVMAPLMPPLLLARALSRLRGGGAHDALPRRRRELSVLPLVNAVALGLLRLEQPLDLGPGLPFGTSNVAVAARPG
jgi:SAM-dependent methyltransferase